MALAARIGWLGRHQLFFGVLTFERDLAQADVLKAGPEQSHWNDAEKRGQQNGRGTGSGGLGSYAKEAGERRGHKGDLGEPAQDRKLEDADASADIRSRMHLSSVFAANCGLAVKARMLPNRPT